MLGVTLAGAFATDNLLLFLVPGAVGVVLVGLFALFIHEPDSRRMVLPEGLTVGRLLRKFVYNPRQYPDYSWNWLGRFLFYFGLTLNTTFTAFFFASRLGVSVTEVAPTIALLSLAGIAATTLGALGGGFLSDRLRRRRIFVLSSGVIFGAGPWSWRSLRACPCCWWVRSWAPRDRDVLRRRPGPAARRAAGA